MIISHKFSMRDQEQRQNCSVSISEDKDSRYLDRSMMM